MTNKRIIKEAPYKGKFTKKQIKDAVNIVKIKKEN